MAKDLFGATLLITEEVVPINPLPEQEQEAIDQLARLLKEAYNGKEVDSKSDQAPRRSA